MRKSRKLNESERKMKISSAQAPYLSLILFCFARDITHIIRAHPSSKDSHGTTLSFIIPFILFLILSL